MRIPLIAAARLSTRRALLVILLGSTSALGCAVFAGSDESTVAQGKYYASGNAYYDQFFVDLYLLQVGMAEAPKTPEAERRRWAQLLQLEAQATPAMIEQRLHEEALNLRRAGVQLRLDRAGLEGGPEVAHAVLRSNARPKENPAAALLATVEGSGTKLLRWQLTMKEKEAALSRLELMTIGLDAGVDRAFSQAPVGKPEQVKKNLADAHKLIPLMRERAQTVRVTSEQLLAALTQGINTDDGAIGPPLDADPKIAQQATEASPADTGKKPIKARPKAKPNSGAPAATHPKPPTVSAEDSVPAKPRAPASKPAPARDFEP